MREWTYRRRIGGLLRCCLGSLDEQMLQRMEAGEGPPKDGDTLTTSCCNTPLVHRDGSWEWNMTTSDFNQKTALNQTLTAPEAGFERAVALCVYLGSFAGDASNTRAFLNIRVLDRSGIPIYGTWPNIGVLASDVIAYALARWAPLLNWEPV